MSSGTKVIGAESDDYQWVGNHQALLTVFGRWPSFHDAEVLSILLDRSDPSLEVRLWVLAYGEGTTSEGLLRVAAEAVVRIRFTRVADIDLRGFNEQNVLSAIGFRRQGTRRRVDLHGIYGVTGRFTCESAEIIAPENSRSE